MTFRSRLFATVALPVLSTSLVATPSLADALMQPFEIAQESTDTQELSEEELQLLREREAEARRAAEEEAEQAGQAAEEAEEEARRAAEEQQAAEEAERAAEEARQAEQDAADEAERAAAEEEAAREAAEQQAAEDAERAAAEQEAAEEAERAAEEARQAEQQAADDEAARAAAEQEAAEEAERAAAAQQAAEQEAERAAQEQRAADEAARAVEEQRAAEEQAPEEETVATPEERPEDAPETAVDEPAAEDPAVAGEDAPPATEGEPATAQTDEAPAAEEVPEIVETLSEEEKQEIAEDPAATDETVVLPVENGAAVLDSDKDADNTGGRASREERRKQREELRAQEEDVAAPDTDATAQALPEEERQQVRGRVEAAISERGERVREAPQFAVPETTNIVNNTVINNTVINNNTVNNTTVNNTVTEVTVRERIDNRTVLSVGDRLIVRGDDRPRLRRDSDETFYDNLSRGRVRETIVRPGGTRIVTVYNRYGDILQRSRIDRDGNEYLLIYAPEEDEGPRPGLIDVGYELPPMRLRIPVSDYIIDTSSDPDRDYYDFLSEPPVERVERLYTIDEVKQSARLRDKVRRIDLDTITFATGSAEVPMAQARTLRSVAEAINKVLDRDPGETFLIEGHTDAVGSDQSNLVLSDRRAESVAMLLSDVYGIPPENLQTQGYGERFLKVRTEAAEQQNRRVTIRRVTTLVRPVAQAN